jgi:hypothetical protein
MKGEANNGMEPIRRTGAVHLYAHAQRLPGENEMELVTILSDHPQPHHHCWCGNDETGNFTWHNRFPIAPDPITIRLSWRAKSDAPEQYIGTFSLHLASLLAAGFITSESSGQVRVKFVNDNGVIRLAPGLRSHGIVLGIRE